MLKLTLAIAAVLAVCSCDCDDFLYPPVGKCRDDIVPIAIDPYEAAGWLRWIFYYGPDSPPYTKVDTVCLDVLDVFPDGLFNLVDRYIMKNNSKIPYFYTFHYNVSDNIVYEESVAGYCGTKKTQIFRNYILDTTEDFALLLYRCSDDGSEDFDVRFIKQPRDNNFTEASEQRLLAKDAEFGFKGNIKRFRSTHGC